MRKRRKIMQKKAAVFMCLAMLLSTGMSFAQAKIDLNGTWEGPTLAEGPEIELTFTLVLEHKGTAITGRLNDDMGYVDCEITEAKLANNVLTFNAVANTPDGDLDMTFKMTVTGNKMEGSWEASDMVSGDWTAEKK